MKSKSQFTLSELTHGLDVIIKGDPNCVILGVATIQQSKVGHITFLTNSHYRKYLAHTNASAVVLSEADAGICPVNAVISANPHYTYAKIAEFFLEMTHPHSGVHETVIMGEGTKIDPSASIGPYCVIGRNVVIGPQVIIDPNCTIGDNSQIGEGSHINAGVHIYHQVTIGKRNVIASGVVIGSEGFGFANQGGAWHKVPQLGGVVIGDDVDIGANTTIDRGAIDDTIVENGVKLDNQIQVGHNVKIGAHTIIAGCVGIAGSATIGKYCIIGGASKINGHISICDHTVITGSTDVSKSVQQAGMYSSGIKTLLTHEEYLKNNARVQRLEKLTQRIKSLEKAIQEIIEKN